MQTLTCVQKLVCQVLKTGAIPKHAGFIMDGNRRFAKKNKLSSTHQGHKLGVKSLKKCLLFCKELGVHEVSLFCFSIQNFSRSQEEVDGLMKLCLQTFQEMSSMSQMLLKNQIKVNIIGRKDKLRDDVRSALQKIETRTKQFKQIVVNLCFAYDSIAQIETSIQKMENPSYKNFMDNLGIPHHLDILVRTANQHRLSNFMLPQAAYAYICILKESWPEVGLLSFCKIIMAYNYHYKDITRNKMLIQQKLSANEVERAQLSNNKDE